MDQIGEDANANRNKNSQQRSNTTVHVCWHRNTSTSLRDHVRSFENELSGFLLRKFKNSNGWQKLWVVFANFCLFFYKAYMVSSGFFLFSTRSSHCMQRIVQIDLSCNSRMNLLWQVFRSWATPLPFQTRKTTYARITCSNFSSKITFTFSGRKVITHFPGD